MSRADPTRRAAPGRLRPTARGGIRIGAPRRALPTSLHLVFLLLVAACAALVLGERAGALPDAFAPALAFPMSFVAVFSLCGLAVNLASAEIVERSQGELHVSLRVLGLAVSARRVAPGEVRAIRLLDAPSWRRPSPQAYLSLFGLGGFRLSLSTGAAEIQLGRMLADAEAQELERHLRAMLESGEAPGRG
ncbi:MAG: hypothetical protein JXR96_00485 [Deltaproteobacteria bacterium]|nr:hypothetical protein [Deltaproteobacteria bacterium]